MKNIYKLKYTNKEAAQADLLQRGILQDIEGELTQTDRTHAVVYVGKIIDTPAQIDQDGNVIVEATFVEGYHVDVMLKDEENFGALEIFPATPYHKFAE